MATRSRRRAGRWVLGLVVLLWLGAVAVLALQARSAGERGLDELDAVRRLRTVDALLDPASGERLDRAADHFADAERSLSNPLMVPARYLPVLGRQIRSARSLNDGAGRAASLASAGLAEFRTVAAERPPDGAARVDALRRLSASAARTEEAISDLGAGPARALIGPLAQARREFVDTRDEAVEGLASARAVLDATADLLDGDHRYLLLGANSAEMRAGSGMFLSAAELTTGGGRLVLGDVEPTSELILPADLSAGGDLARNWPWLPVAQDFRNLALTPRFDITGPIAARMWAELPGREPVDGVIAVDVEALRSLLKVVGPVTVDGTEYSAASVRKQLLHDQYRSFDDNSERRDQLGEVARAVFDQLEGSRFSVRELATELVNMARGRHVLLWSSDATAQAGWAAAGVDGHLSERSLAVSTVNRGANKVDWFTSSAVTVSTEPSSEGTEVTVRVTLENLTPSGEPRYVAGPNVSEATEGEWLGVVVVNLPATALSIEAEGGEYESLRGIDGPTRVVGRYLRIPAGEAATVTIRFVLPPGVSSMTLEPTGRIPATLWTVNEREYERELRRTVAW